MRWRAVVAVAVAAVAASCGHDETRRGMLVARVEIGRFSGFVVVPGCTRTSVPHSRFAPFVFDTRRAAFAFNADRRVRVGTVDGGVHASRGPRPAGDGEPSWGPSGVAYTTGRGVVVVDERGRVVRAFDPRLPHEASVSDAVEAPDGVHFLVTGEWGDARHLELKARLYVVQRRTGHARLLRRVATPYATMPDPVWSPDGRRFAFTDGNPSDLWTMRANGRGARRITRLGGSDVDPLWSPDGTSIAFTSYRDRDDGEVAAAYVARADGSRVRLLTRTAARPLAWSPDGREIALADDHTLAIVRATGGRPRRACSFEPTVETSLDAAMWTPGR